jgi:NTP pyrophosphatase (non-canonical NTP hydrolase)
MNLTEYQKQAAKTAVFPKEGYVEYLGLCYATDGLVGEAGEIKNKTKKLLRGDRKLDESARQDLIDELGDVLWYCAAVAGELGVSLEEVGERNLAKLADRAQRGVIKGSGDKR